MKFMSCDKNFTQVHEDRKKDKDRDRDRGMEEEEKEEEEEEEEEEEKEEEEEGQGFIDNFNNSPITKRLYLPPQNLWRRCSF